MRRLLLLLLVVCSVLAAAPADSFGAAPPSRAALAPTKTVRAAGIELVIYRRAAHAFFLQKRRAFLRRLERFLG